MGAVDGIIVGGIHTTAQRSSASICPTSSTAAAARGGGVGGVGGVVSDELHLAGPVVLPALSPVREPGE